MEKRRFNIPVYIYFFVMTVLIIILFPREGKFRYIFMEGKPWKYGLITAPFDFPIYKSDMEVKREHDSIAKTSRPYFLLNDKTLGEEIEKFKEDYRNDLHVKWDYYYFQYIESVLKTIYQSGIVSTQEYTFLRDNQYNDFMVINNNIAGENATNDLFTIKSAYSYIFDNCPANLSPDVLKQGDLTKYLSENLKFDQKTTDKVKNESLQKVSPARGMVQGGQKIIDRGEIIDRNTFEILNSLKRAYDTKTGMGIIQGWVLTGIIVVIVSLMICFMLYLYYFRPEIYNKRKDVLFTLSLISLFIILTELSLTYNLFNAKSVAYIIPYAIIPIVICTFFDSRTANIACIITVFVCSLMVPFPFEFILLQIVASLVVTFSLKDLSNRFQLIKCSFFVLLVYVVLYLGLILYQEGDWGKINWKIFIFFGINFILLMFTYALVYIIERIFGYTSNVSLIELSDINTPVLRQLSETCPGTFQHSLQVSMLGAAAAGKIGANPLLVRTGALYHDIGKMTNPIYYTENQTSEYNPHDHLTYEQSAQLIIGHVNEGVKIAEKHNLPAVLVGFIKTHHGKGKTKYFYNSFKNNFPDKPINEANFTYPGPNPFSKETAILMMADAVEASSRSLKDHSEESITALVNKIIDAQIDEGLLKNAPITFRDVEDVKSVFIEKLATIYHSRISYPDLKQGR